jgi:hypothetical protein
MGTISKVFDLIWKISIIYDRQEYGGRNFEEAVTGEARAFEPA